MNVEYCGNTMEDLNIEQYMESKYRIKPITHHPSVTSSARAEDQQFFTLVRNKKYKQAYVLGMEILKKRPNNQTVAGFWQFLVKNVIEKDEGEGQESVSPRNQEDEESEEDAEDDSEDEQDISDKQESSEEQQSLQQKEQSKKQKLGDKPSVPILLQKQQKMGEKKQMKIKQPQKQCSSSSSSKFFCKTPSGPQIPRLPLSQTNTLFNTDKVEKQSLKNIINLRLNDESNNQKMRRYQQNGINRSCIRLPYLVKQAKQNVREVNKEKQKYQEKEKQKVKQRKSIVNIQKLDKIRYQSMFRDKNDNENCKIRQEPKKLQKMKEKGKECKQQIAWGAQTSIGASSQVQIKNKFTIRSMKNRQLKLLTQKQKLSFPLPT